MTTFLWLLSAYGVTLILTRGWIFRAVRRFIINRGPMWAGVLSVCPMCLGFWVGISLSLVLGWGPAQSLVVRGGMLGAALSVLLDGVLSSAFNWLLYLPSHLLGEKELLGSDFDEEMTTAPLRVSDEEDVPAVSVELKGAWAKWKDDISTLDDGPAITTTKEP